MIHVHGMPGRRAAERTLHRLLESVDSSVPFIVHHLMCPNAVVHMPHVGNCLHMLIVVIVFRKAIHIVGADSTHWPNSVPRSSNLPA